MGISLFRYKFYCDNYSNYNVRWHLDVLLKSFYIKNSFHLKNPFCRNEDLKEYINIIAYVAVLIFLSAFTSICIYIYRNRKKKKRKGNQQLFIIRNACYFECKSQINCFCWILHMAYSIHWLGQARISVIFSNMRTCKPRLKSMISTNIS